MKTTRSTSNTWRNLNYLSSSMILRHFDWFLTIFDWSFLKKDKIFIFVLFIWKNAAVYQILLIIFLYPKNLMNSFIFNDIIDIVVLFHVRINFFKIVLSISLGKWIFHFLAAIWQFFFIVSPIIIASFSSSISWEIFFCFSSNDNFQFFFEILDLIHRRLTWWSRRKILNYSHVF